MLFSTTQCSPVGISARRDAAGLLTGVSQTIVAGAVDSLLVTLVSWSGGVPGVTSPVVMLLLLLLLLVLLLCLVRFVVCGGGAGSCGAGRSVGRVDLGPGVAVLPGVEAGAGAGGRVDLPGGLGARDGLRLRGRAGGRAHLVRPVEA